MATVSADAPPTLRQSSPWPGATNVTPNQGELLMNNQSVAPDRAPRFRAGAALVAVLALTGCGSPSDGPVAAAPAAPAASPPAATTSPAMTNVGNTSPLSPEAAKAAIRPNGVATCGLLSAAAVRGYLGGNVAAGIKDLRQNEAARLQVDACSFTSSAGAQLSYAVWRLLRIGDQATVEESLPSEMIGAVRCTPKLGRCSAGAVLATGPITVAQVNALDGNRLVLVTATHKDGKVATAAATDAARTLLAVRITG
jgi:hypothetical protein